MNELLQSQKAAMFEPKMLFAYIVFGCIAMGYIWIGKKRQMPHFLWSGILLAVLPYLVSAFWPLFILSAGLTALPIWGKRFF